MTIDIEQHCGEMNCPCVHPHPIELNVITFDTILTALYQTHKNCPFVELQPEKMKIASTTFVRAKKDGAK